MLRSPRAGDRTPAELACVALRQIKATLCKPLVSMRAKWQMWHTHPDMKYHSKVIRVLLQQATDDQKTRLRAQLQTAESTTTRAILRVFQGVLGKDTVAHTMRTMADQELKYRMTQRTAVQFLGLQLSTSSSAGVKRKAPPAAAAAFLSPSPSPSPSPPIGLLINCREARSRSSHGCSLRRLQLHTAYPG